MRLLIAICLMVLSVSRETTNGIILCIGWAIFLLLWTGPEDIWETLKAIKEKK